jgi:hypothetical protein
MTLQGPKPGGWALNEVLTSSQLTALQSALERAVDGVGGGTYNPSPALQLNNTKITLPGIADLKIPSQTLTLRPPMLPAHVIGDWSFVNRWGQSSNAAGSKLLFPLQLKGGDSIQSVTVTLAGGPGHTNLPTVKPTISVQAYRHDNTSQLMGSVTDNPADVSAYQTPHSVILAAPELSVALNPVWTVFLTIEGESGTDSLQSLAIHDIALAVTRTQLINNNRV